MNIKDVLIVGDTIRVNNQIYLWYGNNYIANAFGEISDCPDSKLLEVATHRERLDYFNQVHDNGLYWDDVRECFECEDSTKTKYHHGDILVNEYGGVLNIDGVCIIDDVLCYTNTEKRMESNIPYILYDYYRVNDTEYNYCSKNEMETIPKRKYRIVKFSDNNGIYADRYYIQELKFGFLWFYLCDLWLISSFCEHYTLFNGCAMEFKSMKDTMKKVTRLLFVECKIAQETKTIAPDYKKEIFNVNGIKFK